MEVYRYKVAVCILLTLTFRLCHNKLLQKVKSPKEDRKDCPYTKTSEEVFTINKTEKKLGIAKNQKTQQFLNPVSNFTSFTNDNNETNTGKLLHNDQVDDIIASINRIKNNITSEKNLRHSDDNHLDEAIILNYQFPLLMNETRFIINKNIKNDTLKSEIVDKDEKPDFLHKYFSKVKLQASNIKKDENINNIPKKTYTEQENHFDSEDKPKFVEIMTIEPNNANKANSSSHNILEILKHLMPMFNSTMTKELHNITVIERDHSKNHSFFEIKNISTIVVTYCDKENFTKANLPPLDLETDLKVSNNVTKVDDDYLAVVPDSIDEGSSEDAPDVNLTSDEKKDLIDAAEYGMQKMYELYNVTEPKLYALGMWLDDTNPARYVAAFNAPSDDADLYSRYGYASLQAASRLKELTSGGGNDGLEGRTEDMQFPAASALRQSPLMQHCPTRGTPKCPPASKRYRTHDGICNNFNHPRWGSTMTPVQRFLTPSYSDGIQAPRRSVTGSKLPSAREISAIVHEDQHVEIPSITHLLMQWGQFLDHDITSSSQSRGFNGSVPRCCKDGGKDFVPKELMHPECLPIAVSESDPFYGPRGVRCLDFVRSSPAPRGDCALGWREQLNQVSGYIDGSPLYGSSARKSDKLRLFRNGMVQYGSVGGERAELCRGGALSARCFVSGDARANEQPGLIAAHIVWLRLHNRLAQELANLNTHWSDEKIYQETRKIIGAMLQHITYKEFLPIVLGPEVMRLFDLEPQKKGYYKRYDPKINPSPASSFGSAAFRFGHSLVQPSMMRYDRFHRPLKNNVSLHNEVSNPTNIWSIGAVDRLLLGMVNQPIQKRDEFITEELTNHLFQTPQFDFGMDLAAINIQRGRDHGVPPYTAWREPCGLSQITEFEDLFRVMPSRAVRKMQILYRHVDDIDLFVGGMAERPVIGGLVGPTFACIIAQQFSNIRKGDRFWYENGGFDSSFTPAQLQQIRRISFAQVLCRTLDNIDSIQPFVFLSSGSSNNERLACFNGQINNFDLSPWIEIDSENNDIRKSDIIPNDRDGHIPVKATTVSPITENGNKPQKIMASASKLPLMKPLANLFLFNSTKAQNSITKQKYNTTDSVGNNFYINKQKIDDKLDFKNKTRRFENSDPIDERRNRPTNTQHGGYDDDYDEDDVQSVQSVVINNVAQKRPTYNRPISVTENIDQFTYLINYVPRPTQSWRQTTRRPYYDRDVVKVTYQTYDDTYRRPSKPHYYNRQDEQPMNTDGKKRPTRPDRYTTNTDYYHSSARSNDEDPFDKLQNDRETTENLHKLVTFGYLGTYKGNDISKLDPNITIDDKINKQNDDTNISKDFSTFNNMQGHNEDNDNSLKLSTFYHYETVTKPYDNAQRSTRRDIEELKPHNRSTNDKYYYVKNVLHKYSDTNLTLTEKPILQDQVKDLNQTYPVNQTFIDIQERSAGKLALLGENEVIQSTVSNSPKRKRPQQDVAKTPSVAFEVIPSEVSLSRWAVYEERSDLPDGVHQMPSAQLDPYASRELPRPMKLSTIKKRSGGK